MVEGEGSAQGTQQEGEDTDETEAPISDCGADGGQDFPCTVNINL